MLNQKGNNTELFKILKQLVEEYKLCIDSNECNQEADSESFARKNDTWFKSMINSIINIIKHDGEVLSLIHI